MRDTLLWDGLLTFVLVLGLGPVTWLTAAVPAAQDLPAGAEVRSLDGEPLYPLPLTADVQARLEENLAEAQAAYERNPDEPDAAIWVGRRLAYLGRYQDAIAAFTDAIDAHPQPLPSSIATAGTGTSRRGTSTTPSPTSHEPPS